VLLADLITDARPSIDPTPFSPLRPMDSVAEPPPDSVAAYLARAATTIP
jgi:hypothetical protein